MSECVSEATYSPFGPFTDIRRGYVGKFATQPAIAGTYHKFGVTVNVHGRDVVVSAQDQRYSLKYMGSLSATGQLLTGMVHALVKARIRFV
jgi:hypothetical protein